MTAEIRAALERAGYRVKFQEREDGSLWCDASHRLRFTPMRWIASVALAVWLVYRVNTGADSGFAALVALLWLGSMIVLSFFPSCRMGFWLPRREHGVFIGSKAVPGNAIVSVCRERDEAEDQARATNAVSAALPGRPVYRYEFREFEMLQEGRDC